MSIAKGPVCPKCESVDFQEVSLDDFTVSFFCCQKCGAVIAYRDELLTGQLAAVIKGQDAIIKELKRIR